MSPPVATLFFIIGILGLFLLNRDRNARTSKALWIPVAWLLIAGSRPVSVWLAGNWEPQLSNQYLEGSPLDRNVFIALLALGIITLLMRTRKVGSLLRGNWPLLVFLFYCALSVTWSDYPDVAFKRWIKFLGDFVMILVVVTDPDPLSAIKRFLARAGFVLLPASILLIKYYPSLGRGYSPWDGKQLFTGVGDNKNGLGVISLVLGLGALWHFLELYQNRRKNFRAKQLMAQGIVLLMALWLMWIANSMTSLSCFFMATALIAATKLRIVSLMPRAVHVLIAVMLIVSFSVLFLDIGGGVMETMGRDSTLTGRTEIWKVVLGMKGSPVLGTGFESFWLGKRLEKIWSLYWWHPNEAHDGYLEIFLNLGWIGVTLLALVLLTSYQKVIGAFRRDSITGRLMMVYFVVAVAYNFTESAIRPLSPVWITLILAMTAASSVPGRKDSTPTGNDDSVARPEPRLRELVGVGTS
jgi:O-antigen ligase